MEFLTEYGLFLAKVVTLVAAFALVLILSLSARQQKRPSEKGHLLVKHLNEAFDQVTQSLNNAMLSEDAQKQAEKNEKRRLKSVRKAEKAALKRGDAEGEDSETAEKRVFVLDFDGDVEASAVDNLREEISALLSVAGEGDEVLIRLESAGGVVHGYGLAASQLRRIRDHGVKLTVAVDKVAASGGYMMACLADKLVAAPFAIIGSIGVLVQLPNFHRVLKKHEVDYEIISAGEYKRTLTTFGEITEKGRDKVREDVETIHGIFKHWVKEHRPSVDIDKISTGETWLGSQAKERYMVDDIRTSDECILSACESADVFEVEYELPKSIQEKLGAAFESAIEKGFSQLVNQPNNDKFQ